MSKKQDSTLITVQSASITVTDSPVTVWSSDNYAEDWYRDAVTEARSGEGHDARRREIIFALCFAESFIFEWVRRRLQIDEVNEYFPSTPRFKNNPRYHSQLFQKWKEVPRELYSAGKIETQPNLDLSRLGELFRYRHGLIHAFASRPATDGQSTKRDPFPRKQDLKKLKAGWAVAVVFDLVSALCDQLGEPRPEYLENP